MIFSLNRGFGLPCRMTVSSEQELALRLANQMPTQPTDRLDDLAHRAWTDGQARSGLIELARVGK